MKRIGLLSAAFVLTASLVHAQAVTSYTFGVYNQGAPNPLQSTSIPAASFTCNVSKIVVTGTVVNPTQIAFNDPVNANKDCLYTDPGNGPLLALPFGSQAYEATLTAVNSVGPSPVSARSGLFTRPGATAAAPTGLRVGP